MRVLLINSVIDYGSTGKIVSELAREYRQKGHEVAIAYGRRKGTVGDENVVRIGNDFDVCYHFIFSRLTDKHGLASIRATTKFIRWAENFGPDILWLHNIHGYYINYELLFRWIKAHPRMQVKWTLHDCWAFTGHCSHFRYVKCNKWHNGCYNCPQKDQYPKSLIDGSAKNYQNKRFCFSGVQNMTLITPSNWMKELVTKSFLHEYPIEVLYNVVDREIFKNVKNSVKYDLKISEKKMVLGVASIWNARKGLDDFVELSKQLDSSKYQVVLVGLNQKQIAKFRRERINIIALPRMSEAIELAKMYSAADIFVNPSYEETFGLTTVEAQACGTYTIVYKDTACEEIVDNKNGTAVESNVDSLVDEIVMYCEKRIGLSERDKVNDRT